MKVALTFTEGPTETSESFVVAYRNQFGVVCFAWQDADGLVGFLAPEVQEDWSEDITTGEWPTGSGAGVYADGEP